MTKAIPEAAFGCVAHTIRLRSGRYFDFDAPQPDQFTLRDIAGALAKTCRFGGQIERFYSVAEHSVHAVGVAISDGLPPAGQLAVFAHDWAEAFVGDVVKPLKILLGEHRVIESRVEQVIAEKFGIDFATWGDAIREIDHALLIAERRALFTPDAVTWYGEESVRRLAIEFPCWGPDAAEGVFLGYAARLLRE